MKRLLTLCGLAFVLLVGGFLALRPAPPAPTAPVVIMPQLYTIPPQKLSLFNAWVPQTASWAWLWRLKEQLVGRPKAITLTTTFIHFTASGTSFITNLSLPKPQFTNANGLAVWFLPDLELTRLLEGFKQHSGTHLKRYPGTDIVASPRITTADGLQARLFSGTPMPINGLQASVGESVDLLARVRAESTDLTVILKSTQAITNQPSAIPGSPLLCPVSIQTNLAIAARFQLPNTTGVFLVDTGSSPAEYKRTGVILTVTTPPPRQ